MLPKHTAQMFSTKDLFQNCISIGGVLPISGLFSDLHLFSPAELFRITPGLDAMVTTGLHPVRMKCTRSSLRIQFLLVPLESTVSPTLDSWTCLWCGCVGQRHLFFPQGVFFGDFTSRLQAFYLGPFCPPPKTYGTYNMMSPPPGASSGGIRGAAPPIQT